MKGVLPWLVRWVRCAGTRDFCPALVAVFGPVQNIFFLTILSVHLSPSPYKLARQSCWVTGLLVCVSCRGTTGSAGTLLTLPGSFTATLNLYNKDVNTR
jgi:hypothetical protein